MATIQTLIDDQDQPFVEPTLIPDRDLRPVPDINVPAINRRGDLRNQTLLETLDKMAVPLHVDAAGVLLKQWLSYKGFGDHHIDSYDNWIIKSSMNNVYSRALLLPNGDMILSENLRIFEPRYSRDGKVLLMTPKLAREQGVTYGNDWHVDIVQRRNGVEIASVRSVCIGTIPTMLKSVNCILRNKTPRELALLGEDPEDPGGYFIVGGTEKYILLQEQLAVGKIFTMNLDTKGTTVVRMTANTTRGTALIELALDKKTKSVLKIRFPSLRNADQGKKYRSINVLRVFRLLNMHNIKDIEALITLFIKPENVKKSMLQLTRNVVDFMVFPDDITIIAAKLGKAPEQINETLDTIKYIVDTDLFPHVNNLPGPDNETDEEREARIRTAKLNLLAIMVARFVEYLAGYRPLDNRDSWSNKRVQGAGNMMEQLFRNAWRKTLGIAQNDIDRKTVRDLNSIVEKIRYSIITDTFHDSFITSNWGVRGTQMKNNIAQTLQRDSVIATYAHINTIDVAISRTDRQPSLRVVQMDQWGFVDPVSTPEGENAGLVKALSLLAETSLDRNDNEIIRLLIGSKKQGMLELVSPSPSVEHPDKIIINGKFLGWCNGSESREILVNMRRNGEIPLDLSVILDDDWLYIDVTPSRLIRPVLIVDADQKLAIDRLNLWDKPNDTLLKSGAVEYISPWEQEYLKIAVDVKEIAKRKEQIADAEKAYTAAVGKLQELKARKAFQDLQKEQGRRSGNQELVTDIELKELEDLVQGTLESRNKALLIKPYTHCEIDSTIILSVASALIPWPNHNQAPRNTYQVSMGKQALGVYHRNHKNRFDGKTKLLCIPARPMVETEMSSIIGLDQRGPGENVYGSFMAFPYTEEDSFIMKREYLDNGGMRIMKYLVYKTIVRHSGDNIEILKRPEALPNEPANRYKYIQMYEADNPMNGLPMYGAPLNQGDCIIGKIQYTAITNAINNESVFLRVGDEGIVDKVSVTSDNKTTTITVKLRIMRVPQEGDKFAPRNAQKGTVGLVISESYLPANRNGVASDITMNPHSMPSRMTMEYPMEIIAATAGAYGGTRENATAFRPFPLDTYRKTLIEYVVNQQPEAQIPTKDRTEDQKKILQSLEFGYNIMTSGISGRSLEVPIYGGLVFFQALKHHVKDKIQARSTGQVKPMTRQPPKGRGNRGGLRFGEMERDAAISHGASSLLRERLMKASDAYTCVFCRTCGNFAVNDIGSPTGEPLEQEKQNYKNCRLCDDNNFGRCVIPYAYKLLVHLLAPFQQYLRPEFVTFEELLDSIFTQQRRIERGDLRDVERELTEADEGFEDEALEAEQEQGIDTDLGDVYE